MNGNTNMRTTQQVFEITGAPAQVWGNVLVPARGTIIVKVTGDTLVGTTKTGLEKRETQIRIQNIDSVETLEAPIYALLGFGVFLAFSALGAFSNSLKIFCCDDDLVVGQPCHAQPSFQFQTSWADAMQFLKGWSNNQKMCSKVPSCRCIKILDKIDVCK